MQSNTALLSSAHGSLGASRSWEQPLLKNECAALARPDYATTRAHEYEDEPAVLAAKVDLLCDLLQQSKRTVAYTGAGISTSSGVPDYATRAETSLSARPALTSPYSAQPTPAHRVLARLHAANLLHSWVQQNHDGLPQKAGYPTWQLNEIHGAWHDPSNPVVKMSGTLRPDLCQWLEAETCTAELVLALGTSLSGMHADMLATAPHKIGTVIVSLQRTPHDATAALRIFAPLDTVFAMVAARLGGLLPNQLPPLPPPVLPQPAKAAAAADEQLDQSWLFAVPYDHATGDRTEHPTGLLLDLSPGKFVRLTAGPHAGDVGEVTGRDAHGNFQIVFQHLISKKTGFRAPFPRVLGPWWVSEAVSGLLPKIPVVPCPSPHGEAQ